MENESLLTLLLKAKASLEVEYQYQADDVDWFNNNTPNVGISIEYKTYPQKSEALKYIDEAIKYINLGVNNVIESESKKEFE